MDSAYVVADRYFTIVNNRKDYIVVRPLLF